MPEHFATLCHGVRGIEGVHRERLLDMFAQDPGEITLSRTTPATDVTGNFLRYARPLIGEDWPDVPLEGCQQRFVRLQPIRAETRLAAYVPEAHRE